MGCKNSVMAKSPVEIISSSQAKHTVKEKDHGAPVVGNEPVLQVSATNEKQIPPSATDKVSTPPVHTVEESALLYARLPLFAGTTAIDPNGYLRKLPNPDGLLEALHKCWQRSERTGPAAAVSTASDLYQHFLHLADSNEDVVRMLAFGLSAQVMQQGIWSFDARLHEALKRFYMDPSTKQATAQIHNESAEGTLRARWRDFKTHFQQEKIANVYILNAVTLLLETPCELDFGDGFPVRCAGSSKCALPPISLTFTGGEYRETGEVQEAEAQSRIESFQLKEAGLGSRMAGQDAAGQQKEAPALVAVAAPLGSRTFTGNLGLVAKADRLGEKPPAEAGPAMRRPRSEYLKSLVELGLNKEALKKLESPEQQLTPSESLSCVLSCIQTGKKKTRLAEGADLVLVIGNTGAGKSTTINYLSGCEIVAKSTESLGVAAQTLDAEVLTVRPRSEGGPKDPVTSMGHGWRSETFIPEIAEPVGSPNGAWLTFCDTPGFLESRGAEISIANAVNTKHTFSSARCVRVLALVEFEALRSKGSGAKQMIEIVAGLFGSEETALKHTGSIQLVVTKAQVGKSLRDIRAFLTGADNPDIPALFKRCAEKLLIVDPLNQHDQHGCRREDLLNAISMMPGIEDPGTIFQTYLTASDKEAIGRFTEPFVCEIMSAIADGEYGPAKEKFVALQDLGCLEHRTVKDVLAEAKYKMKAAIHQLGEEVTSTLNEAYTRQDASIQPLLQDLLERLNRCCILDECFEGELPADTQRQKQMKAVEQFERRLVEDRDRKLEAPLTKAMGTLVAEIHAHLQEASGGLFKDLDVEKSVEDCRLVPCAGSTHPEPPSSLLPSLAALKWAFTELASEMQDRPSRYCLHCDVENLKQMESTARQELAKQLRNAVLVASRKELMAAFQTLLSEMQTGFQEAIEGYMEEILRPHPASWHGQDTSQLFQAVEAWFARAKPGIATKMKEVHEQCVEKLVMQDKEALLSQLVEKLELLRQQARERKEQLQAEASQQELQKLRSLIVNKSVEKEDVARNAQELQAAFLRMEELGAAAAETIQECLQLLQQKITAYASVERLQQLFGDCEFQRLADLLQDSEKLKGSFGERFSVPLAELREKFRALFAEERQRAVAQMRSETAESGALERFTEVLRAISQVQKLNAEFVKPHEDQAGAMQGVPWGAEDDEIIREGCRSFQTLAGEKKYPEAARCLVKYRRICSLLREGHFSQSYREGIQQLIRPGGTSGQREADDAVFNIGQELQMLMKSPSEHPDIRMTAQEIIETFKVFSKVNVELFNKVAGGVSFDQALGELKDILGNAMFGRDGEQRLKNCYAAIMKAYEEPIKTLLREKNEEAKQNAMDTIFQKCKDLANKVGKYQRDFSTSTVCAHASELLGNIFAMWSITSSGEDYVEGRMDVIVQPHAPQILAVLHMLGIGIGGEIKNHIAQIGTGQGKSICLGVLGTFFCLIGFKVNIVCYSPFLSERDQERFRLLFTRLSVWPTYCDVFGLCNQVLQENFDVRRLAVNVLRQDLPQQEQPQPLQEEAPTPTKAEPEPEVGGWLSSLVTAFGLGGTSGETRKAPAATPGRPTSPYDNSILLIDEVDVFFGEEFYGRSFVPSIILDQPECVSLVEWVWQHRGEALTQQEVLRQPEAKAVRRLFPGMQRIGDVDLLNAVVEQMLHDVRAFPMNNNTEHEYEVGKDEHGNWRVGYLDSVQGVVDYYTYQGYLTAFAYAHAVANRKITDLSEKASMMGFNLPGGMLPYADLPNFFGLKLGLTGSLQSASRHEMEILKTRYRFTRFSLMPSIFVKQPLNVTDTEVIPGEVRGTDFFCKIRAEIEEKRRAGRASLVIFESRLRLQEFWQYLRTHSFPGKEKVVILTEELGTAQKEEYIAQAARSRRITLTTQAFGRGSDFVCRDHALVNAGGLHVIQTFASELKSGHVQIKGRTGRQSDPGSYCQILFLADLQPFGIDGQQGYNEYEAWKGDNAARTWDQYIDEKREEVLLTEKFRGMNAALQQAEASYVMTRDFVASAKQGDWQAATNLWVKLSKGAHGLSSGARAVVFVIDRTWQPILDACITSIETIFRDLLKEWDIVGLYSLGEGWIFAPAPKGPNYEQITSLLSAARVVSGRPVLYQSMLQALQCLAAIPRVQRWLVVLSDTVDLEEVSGEQPWASGHKVLAQREGNFEEGTVASTDGDSLDVAFTSGNSMRVQKAKAHPFVKEDDLSAEMRRRLLKAGARTGQVTISLMWDTTDDLDLHVETPSGEIWYSNKTAGGGWLDVDMNVSHNTQEPVENIFWQEIPNGDYKVKVVLFSRGGAASRSSIPYSLAFRCRVPVAMGGATVHGTKLFNGSLSGTPKVSDTVCTFSVNRPRQTRAECTSEKVREALRTMENLSIAIIDSKAVSGWSPDSPKWPTFHSNVEHFVADASAAHGGHGYYLEAANEAGIAEKFSQVATIMLTGHSEKKPVAKRS